MLGYPNSHALRANLNLLQLDAMPNGRNSSFAAALAVPVPTNKIAKICKVCKLI